MLSNMLTRVCIKYLEDKLFALTVTANSQQFRERHKLNPKPKLRNPVWFIKKDIHRYDDAVTQENKDFIKEVIQDKADLQSPLAKELLTNITAREWNPALRRTGVIARKIGIYPMWTKTGKKVSTTLLQVLDNHVIKYYTPEEYTPGRPVKIPIKNKKACLLIGAEAVDPTTLTKEYCGLFKNTGVLPKKHLARFYISPEAMLPPGTPLTALHFQVGNVIDVRGKTIDRGFQGVMKRHGFSGMPASHGVTKTHRRGGNIGGGGQKARVWPGTKMPGHMGNRFRILRGLKILRINTKFNVLYVTGQAIPGETNSIVTLYDTVLPLRKATTPVPFPTYLRIDEQLPVNMYSEEMHMFNDPTIEYHES